MSESKVNKNIDEYLKDLIVKAVEEKAGNDAVNEYVDLIMRRINENYVHLSRPVIMVHIVENKDDKGEVKKSLNFFLGKKSRATIVQAFGEVSIQVPAAIQYMDFQQTQKKNETGLIVPGDNGKNRIGEHHG